MNNTYTVRTRRTSDLSRTVSVVPPIKATSPFQAAVNAARFLGWDRAEPKLVAASDGVREYETATTRFIVAAA